MGLILKLQEDLYIVLILLVNKVLCSADCLAIHLQIWQIPMYELSEAPDKKKMKKCSLIK